MQCTEDSVRFTEYSGGAFCKSCSTRPLAGNLFPFWGRGDAMENVKINQAEQGAVEEFLDELLDEALDRDERDANTPYCTCPGSCVTGTKCI